MTVYQTIFSVSVFQCHSFYIDALVLDNNCNIRTIARKCEYGFQVQNTTLYYNISHLSLHHCSFSYRYPSKIAIHRFYYRYPSIIALHSFFYRYPSIIAICYCQLRVKMSNIGNNVNVDNNK